MFETPLTPTLRCEAIQEGKGMHISFGLDSRILHFKSLAPCFVLVQLRPLWIIRSVSISPRMNL